jgi:predicted alpha-1,2-mannosidase
MPRALALGICVLAACNEAAPMVADHSGEVDPFIGSGGVGFGVGSISPGPSMPFGLAKPAPDTSSGGSAPGFSHCAGYWWEDDEIRAFSQLHLSGTGVPDYGVLGVMPASLDHVPSAERDWRARFDHRSERASLGRYEVTLAPSGIQAIVSATSRTSVYRFTYPEGSRPAIVISLDHGLGGGETRSGELAFDTASQEITGELRHAGDMSGRYGGFELFFAMRFEAPVSSFERFGERDGVIFFDGGARSIGVQIGLSFVDLEGAKKNLDAEWMGFDLARAESAIVSAWAPILGMIEIDGGTRDERRMFYSSLYRAHLMPTMISDSDGRYFGFDRAVHDSEDSPQYSDFSLWDTFRTLHPLYVLLEPALAERLNRSLVRMLEQNGHAPRWPLGTGETWTMIGNHGETVLVDSYLKGIRGFDQQAIFERLLRAANEEIDANGTRRAGRECIASYLARGYCAADEGDASVSRTLENAFNDALLANIAEALGHDTEAVELHRRASSWKNLLDREVGFFRSRNSDGSFASEFDEELFSSEYTEGNARQWLAFVPHDLEGLAGELGGKDAFLSKLEGIFESTITAEKTPLPDLWYWHGNEPDIHAPYIFAELGRPDLTRRYVRWIMDHRYAASPAGLDGNDDGGTLSAWYVFGAIGFYPKVGTSKYVLSVPRFPKATLKLEGGASLVVIAEGLAEGKTELDRVELDGRTIEGPFIDHADLLKGGELVFHLR